MTLSIKWSITELNGPRPESRGVSRYEEADLIEKWNPVCNG